MDYSAQTAVSQVSGLGAINSPLPKQRSATHVEGLITRMASLTGDARTIEGMLNEIHERAFGPSPDGGKQSGQTAREVRSGAHGAAADRLDDIEAALSRIRTKVDQLSTFV